MSAYSPIDIDNAISLDGGRHAEQQVGLRFGVEMLAPDGWRPLRGWFGRTPTFATKDEATRAAVAAWRKSDRAARPYLIHS